MIEFDFTNVLEMAVGAENGIPASAFKEPPPFLDKTVKRIESQRSAGDLGFADLPFRQDLLDTVCQYADKNPYPHLLIIGIGGSALGAIALDDALGCRASGRTLSVLDNVDPDFILRTLDQINPKDVIVNVIAKSGVTVETMTIFSIVRQWLIDAIGEQEARSRFVVTTDPKQGDLIGIAQQEGYSIFEIPTNVPGRFSVLSAVGILPCALLGLDVSAILSGAQTGVDNARRPTRENAALQMAFIQQFLDQERSKPILTLFPYCQSLWKFAFWYKQLWAESLGKKENRNGQTIYVGQTPITALGVTDQHSQLQLFMEGPNNKSFVFWNVAEFRNRLSIGADFSEYSSLGYLQGKEIAEVLRAEKEATEIALTEAGRPNLSISLDRLDEEHFGELIMFSEYTTVYTGELYNINTFNQPGVDYGKRLTFSILGRDGFLDCKEPIKRHRNRKRMVIR